MGAQVKHVETVKQYLDEVTIRGDEAIFRGQPVDKPLLPKVFRNYEEPYQKDLELRLFHKFRRKAAAYVDFRWKSDLDCLSVAQHYGLPTRLLDWTSKPLPALWFAVSIDPETPELQPVVWIVKVHKQDIVPCDSGRNDKKARTRTAHDKPFDVKRTWVVFPDHIDGRIASQDGCFTLHPDRNCFRDGLPTAFESNKRYGVSKGNMKKIMISASHVGRLRKELNDLGVNEAKLFPDTIGLCRHLAWDHKRVTERQRDQEK